LPIYRGRLYRRQRTIAEQHELPQVHAVDELENEEAVASRLARVDRADGVRMADARGQAGFLEEPRLEVFVIAQVRMDDLDRELARETSRPRQPSEIHGGHASGRDPAEDLIAAQRRDRGRVAGGLHRRESRVLGGSRSQSTKDGDRPPRGGRRTGVARAGTSRSGFAPRTGGESPAGGPAVRDVGKSNSETGRCG